MSKRTVTPSDTEEEQEIQGLYRFVYILLCGLWILFIYQLSSQPSLGGMSFRIVNLFLFQTASFFIYSMLGLLLFLSIFPFGYNMVRKTGIVLGCVFIIAGMDEWNQSYLHRGSFTDVVVDLTGALLSLLILNAAFALNQRRVSGKWMI